MVQPFERALNQIAKNTSVMAEQLPIITDSVKKLYQVENEERNKEEKKSIEKERQKADPSGGQGENAGVIKEIGALQAATKKNTEILKEILKTFKEGENKKGLFGSIADRLNPFSRNQKGGFIYDSPVKGFSKGGGVFTVPGNSTGDKHPMLLPAGSFVLNRNASKYITSRQSGGVVPTMLESQEKVFEPGSWSGLIPILNSVIPRFASSGIIDNLFGFNNANNIIDSFSFGFTDLTKKFLGGLRGLTNDQLNPGISGKMGPAIPYRLLVSNESSQGDNKTAGYWRPLLDAIASAESIGGSYSSAYHPKGPKIIPGLETMSIEEAVKSSGGVDRGGRHYAIGRYQFTSLTSGQAALAGLSPSDIFSPENQDKMAIALIEKKKRITREMIRNNPTKAQLLLSQEWAGLPQPGGGSYYGGDGVNKSNITEEALMRVFAQMRQTGGSVRGAGLQPVMVESGEKIFSPGSYGSEIPMLNEAVPRFQSGGAVNVSRSLNPIHELFQEANKVKMGSEQSSRQPIVIPVPQPVPTGGGGMTNNETSGSFTPNLPNEPSNHIVSTLIMQTYALMNRIG